MDEARQLAIADRESLLNALPGGPFYTEMSMHIGVFMFVAEDNDIYLRQMIPANGWSVRREETATPLIAWLLFDYWSDEDLFEHESLPHKSKLLSGDYDQRIKHMQVVGALLATGEIIYISEDDPKGDFFLSVPNAKLTGRGDEL